MIAWLFISGVSLLLLALVFLTAGKAKTYYADKSLNRDVDDFVLYDLQQSGEEDMIGEYSSEWHGDEDE